VAILLLAPPLPAQSGVAQSIRYGEVLSVERTVVVEQATGKGAAIGSTVGAIAGYALTDRRDRWLGGMVGGALGGLAGGAMENSSRKRNGWELIIKVEGGEEIGIQVAGKKQEHRVGDRVRLMVGPGGTTQVKTIAADEGAASSAPAAPPSEPVQRPEGLSVRYQAHVVKRGWVEWVKDGSEAGTVGEGRRVEAIRVELVGETGETGIRYRTHLSGQGWLDWATGGGESGAPKQKRAVEAFEIELLGPPTGLHVRYRAHVAKVGWQDWVEDGATAGTTGRGLQVEAIRVELVRR